MITIEEDIREISRHLYVWSSEKKLEGLIDICRSVSDNDRIVDTTSERGGVTIDDSICFDKGIAWTGNYLGSVNPHTTIAVCNHDECPQPGRFRRNEYESGPLHGNITYRDRRYPSMGSIIKACKKTGVSRRQ